MRPNPIRPGVLPSADAAPARGFGGGRGRSVTGSNGTARDGSGPRGSGTPHAGAIARPGRPTRCRPVSPHACARLALAGAVLLGLSGAACARDVREPDESTLDRHGHYRSRDGSEVHRPAKTRDGGKPAGATAKCRDDTWSFSHTRRGTCSGHGGVARWEG